MDLILTVMLAAYLFGAAGSSVFRRSAPLSLLIGQGAAILAGGTGLALSSAVLLGGETGGIALSSNLPLLAVQLRVDPLAAFFILLISLVSLAVSVYSIGYMRTYAARYSPALFGVAYNFFLFSLVAVVCAANGFLFLIFWESMSLSSFLLVNYEDDRSETRKAAFTYIVMTHVGTAFISVAFLLCFFASGSFDFEAIKNVQGSLSGGLKGIVFLCALVGFGTKAGLVPLHIWLPAAHPAAPSNVSALMSGVMIKIAVYGLLRVGFDLLGPGSWWWGGTVVTFASITSLLGIFYAIEERNIKRLLAYSSIENIGIVLIGVGTAMIFGSFRLREMSALALIAALYHALNHAMFKGLLFLGAGAVVSATGTKDMEKMGGLIHRMPYTAFFFLVGAVSISALPPFNGFVSEWLTFQSLLLTVNVPKGVVKMILPGAGALLALTGALAAACFVKAFGIAFLAAPRSAQAREAGEAGRPMRFGMGILALFCLLFGIFPGGVISVLERVSFSLTDVPLGETILKEGGWVVIPLYERFSSLSTGWLAVGMGGAMLGGLGAAVWIGGRRRVRVGETWACGIPELKPRMEYTATGYSKSIRLIFRFFYRPQREISVRRTEGEPYAPAEVSYRAEIEHLVEKYLYRPLVIRILQAGERVKILQSGSVHAYLAYLFMTLVLGLVALSVLM